MSLVFGAVIGFNIYIKHTLPDLVFRKFLESLFVQVMSDESLSIEIMNMYGKKVYSSSNALTSGVNELNIDLNEFASGVYFITTIGDIQGAKTIRFIKD